MKLFSQIIHERCDSRSFSIRELFLLHSAYLERSKVEIAGPVVINPSAQRKQANLCGFEVWATQQVLREQGYMLRACLKKKKSFLCVAQSVLEFL